MAEETVVDHLVFDEDPRPPHSLLSDPVTVGLELPPRAQSAGWGEIPVGRRR